MTMTWDEMLQVQQALPESGFGLEQPPSSVFDVPAVDLADRQQRAVRQHSLIAPIQQLVGLCSVDLTSSKGFASQADGPDGGNFFYIPPDVAGGVGPDHLMTMVNNKVLVQDRLGSTISQVDLLAFWSALSATSTTYSRLSYDAISSKWIASGRGGTGGAMQILLGVSQTSDPTGTWNFYSIAADTAGTTFPDWLTQGWNQTWIAMGANMFNVTGGAFAGAKMWVADRSTIGGPLTVTVFPAGFMSTVHGAGLGGNSVHPARALDNDATLWIMNNAFTAGPEVLFQLTRMTGTGAAPVLSALPGSVFGANASITSVGTNWSATLRHMPQVAEPTRLVSMVNTRLGNVMQRNGKLWTANGGAQPGPANNTTPSSTGVVWHEVNPALPLATTYPAPSGSCIVQSGVILGPTGSASTVPSIAVNCGEDLLVGFSYGDNTRHPSCAWAARLGTDPLGSMGPLQILKDGDSSYWKNFGVGTTAQWGRYSSTAVDPVDDTTMWTLQEYAGMRVGPADNDSRWATWWGRRGECGEPTITDQPDPLTLCLGDAAVFSVSATASNGGLAYQWRKNGTPISGETSSTFTIPATVASDGALYDVVIDDGCGSVVSASALLDFAGALISQHPMDVHAGIGDPASFTVVASGTGTLTYQWRKNGNPISGANSATYSIASVTGADYGTYDCIVTDDCGPVLSNSARLKLAIKPNNVSQAELSFHIFQQPASVAGCLGGQVTLEVVAYPDDVTYVWRKDGTPISPPETASTLTLSGLAYADAGAYDVVVSHGSQSKASDDAILVVHDVPVITDHPDNVDAMLGEDVMFSVTATGAGPLQYQWEKKSNPFVPFQPVAGATGSVLILHNVRNGNSGSYRCVVTNHCGSVISDVAQLSIVF